MGGRGSDSGLSGGGGVTATQNKTVDKIVKQTRDLKNEQFRIIDEDGNVVLVKRGSEHMVAATVGEKREFMDGAVSIHNHPDGGTFSDADLSDFGYGARQMVVASPEGTYKLTNTKYGQFDAKHGWYDMREDMQKKGVTAERSFTDINKAAMADPRVKRASDAASKVAKQWVDARNAGKPQSVLDKLVAEYNKRDATYKSILKTARRDAETRPYHDYFKANAKKYGFEYSFTKRP